MTAETITPTAIDAFVHIEFVRVVGRHRYALGDLTELAGSIDDIGLLHPVTLTRDGRLIAGHRRLEACRLLGWTEIPARFVDSLDDAARLLRAERDTPHPVPPPRVCGAKHKYGTPPSRCLLDPDHDGDHVDEQTRTWHNYGPIQHYEITWMSGHVETVIAHQVSWPQQGMVLARAGMSFGLGEQPGRAKVEFHAEIDGRWRLTLSAPEEDIRTIRLVTQDEAIPRV